MDEKRKPALALLCLILAVLMVFAMMPGMAYAGVKKNTKLKNITGRVKNIPSNKVIRSIQKAPGQEYHTVLDTDLSVKPGDGVEYDVEGDQTEAKGNVYVKPGTSFNVQEKIDCTYLESMLVEQTLKNYLMEGEQYANGTREMKGTLNVKITVPGNVTVQTDQVALSNNDAVSLNNSSIKTENNNDGTTTYTIPLSVMVNKCSEYVWAELGTLTINLPMKMSEKTEAGTSSVISSNIPESTLNFNLTMSPDGNSTEADHTFKVTDKQAKGGTYNDDLVPVEDMTYDTLGDAFPYWVLEEMGYERILNEELNNKNKSGSDLTDDAQKNLKNQDIVSKMAAYAGRYTTNYGSIWDKYYTNITDKINGPNDLEGVSNDIGYILQFPKQIDPNMDSVHDFITVNRLLPDGTDFTEKDKSSTATQLTIRTPYKVTFHKDSEDKDNFTQDVKNEGKVNKPADPTRDGYEFAGWYTDKECKTAYNFDTPVNSNFDLYAKWTKKAPAEHTVTFHPNNGQNNSTQTVTDGSKLTKPADPAKSGYKFDGWYTDSDLKTAYDFSKVVTSDMDLYAKWTKVETPVTPVTPVEDHTVTFHPANGQSNFTQNVSDGSKVSQPADPTQNGYTFNGWYTDSALTKAYDFSTPVTSDLDLYAKWTKNTPAPTPASDKVTGILLPKVIANGSSEQTLTWTPLTHVDGYFVYEAECNTPNPLKVHHLKKVADVSASSPRVYKRTGLKKGVAYKYRVAAYKVKDGKKQIVKTSVAVHSAAGNLLKKKSGSRYTNVKKVSVRKNAVTMKIGKTYKIQPSVKGVVSGCAILQKDHAPMYRYLYIKDGKNIRVDQNGNVKALKAGKCNVYVLGTNGVRTKVAVTVVK